MNNSVYNHYATQLKEIAKIEKRDNPNDKARVRQVLNDSADNFRRGIHWHAMKEKISEKQAKLYCNWIESLTCRLHP